jgi:hypothetical protein
MYALTTISSPFSSDLATPGSKPSTNIHENFSEFNTIDDPNTNILMVQGPSEKTETETETEIAINYDVEGEEDSSAFPQYVTYIDHPIIKNKFNLEYEEPSPSKKDQHGKNSKDINVHFDGIVNFYFASISVVGLFILFRAIQKSKY